MTTLPLGQLFVFGFEGTLLEEEAKKLLHKEKAAGVILFGRNIDTFDQLIALNSQVVAAAGMHLPAIISVDQEGGRVQRLKNICTKIPDMRTIGALSKSDPQLPYRLGAMMARELCALGFNLDFAPVMDVDTNPKNPVIAERSFSSDAQEVASLGTQLIRGMQGAGVAACAKHFPGHGDTEVDSHLDLPIIHHDKHRLDNVELFPFAKAVDADVASIMTAHVLVPALDQNAPATMSASILHILRHDYRFEGLIISDDINMGAIQDHYDLKEVLAKGFRAGIDIFLICRDTQKTQAAIEVTKQLVTDKIVPKAQIEAALRRVANFKRRFIGAVALPDPDYAKQIVACHAHLELAKHWQAPKEAKSSRQSSLVDD